MNKITWQEAQNVLQTGDVLIKRSSSLEGRIISNVTHFPYSHAAMAGWASTGGKNLLLHGETVGHRNAHLIDLELEIRDFSGYYDAFRVLPEAFPQYDPEKAWYFMCRCAGSGYGWSYIWRTWLRRRLGNWVPPIPSSDAADAQRDCSGLVHACWRYGSGPQKARDSAAYLSAAIWQADRSLLAPDMDVCPGDLTNPEAVSYLGTLYYK